MPTRRTTARTTRAFTVSRVGRALTILAGVPADEIPELSPVDGYSDKRVTHEFTMLVLANRPWFGEA